MAFWDKLAANFVGSSAQKTIKFHGEFHATTSTGGTIVLYTMDGTSITLATNDRLVITSAWALPTVAGDTYIYCDNASGGSLTAGELVIRGTVAANQLIGKNFDDPFISQTNVTPLVVCASGTIDAGLTGYVRRGGNN